MAFQLLGGILAGLLLNLVNAGKGGCGCPNGMGSNSVITGALMEFFATWFLMFVIVGTAVDPNAPKGIYGAAIGGTLTMCIYGIGPITGGALNPFRAYGPQLGAFISKLMFEGAEDILSANASSDWIYLMPFLGALVAAFMGKVLLLQD